jgi:hypothetical protein
MESRDSSRPSGIIPPLRPPPGGRSSSSSSSDSDSDRPKDLGKEILKLIWELQKKDKKNHITKQPEAVFLGKAPKMKEPEVFDGDWENYILWMKVVKEYMTVQSININNDTTSIHWLGSLLKGDACQWHQNHVDTIEKEFTLILSPHTLQRWTTTSVIPTRNATKLTKWPGCTGNINLDATRLVSQLTNGESGWPYTKKRPKWKEKS